MMLLLSGSGSPNVNCTVRVEGSAGYYAALDGYMDDSHTSTTFFGW